MADKLTNQIREHRKLKNLTQAALAAQIGVSRKTINTIENNIYVPSTVLALQLAATLETDIHQLFQLIEQDKS